ncbi:MULTISPECIES: LuxR family transcriptional regulator [unclassified Halomonas]|uniref:LuxR family transcriptional regulator n=1 Tax=unclassified Halomonas TaxID=2609666 RepID=UPI000990664F|nr:MULTISPECIES: LuxR family transcriptional regulator [unclassified Halomonas]AQU81284.1 hypothetical protein B2G49_00830 [Halomonas sp. 'Soap Lake \
MRENDVYLLAEVKHNISKRESEYKDVLSWAFEKIGITYFSYVYVGRRPSEADKAIILGNYPKDWVDLYESHALFRKDPVINHSFRTSTAFFWGQVKGKGNNSEHIFDLSAQYGIEQGFTIPVHDPGCAFGSMHFAASQDDSEFLELIEKHSDLISIISYIAHQQRPVVEDVETYPRLTEREIECLHWVAMGKSYGEIALILSVSERTIKFHAQNIIKKMNSINIRQAMTKALQLNLI